MGKDEAIKHSETGHKDNKNHLTFSKFMICTMVAETSFVVFLFLISLTIHTAITVKDVFEGSRPWWHLLIVAIGLFALSMFIYSASGTARDFIQKCSVEETNEEK